MTDAFQYDVFLSHNPKDKPRVRPLAERLKAAGLRVWFDEWVLQPGADMDSVIERGLESARVQVLCLSPAALASDWVALERNTALFRDPGNTGRRFIPLLLADCDVPDALRRYKVVDFREETEAGFAELVAACRSEEEAAGSGTSKGSARKKGQAAEPPEEGEPLAVLERKLTGHMNWVWSVAISPDGTWAASGSRDKTAKIWDLESGGLRGNVGGPSREGAIGRHLPRRCLDRLCGVH
jgi:hypothetical protein